MQDEFNSDEPTDPDVFERTEEPTPVVSARGATVNFAGELVTWADQLTATCDEWRRIAALVVEHVRSGREVSKRDLARALFVAGNELRNTQPHLADTINGMFRLGGRLLDEAGDE